MKQEGRRRKAGAQGGIVALTRVVSEGLPTVTREEVTGLEAVSGRRLPSSRGTKDKGSEAGWCLASSRTDRFQVLWFWKYLLLLKWKPRYYFPSQDKSSINTGKKMEIWASDVQRQQKKKKLKWPGTMRKGSASRVIREKRWEATARCHCTPTG